MVNLEQTIDDIIKFGLRRIVDENMDDELLYLLSALQYHYYTAEDVYDDMTYSDPPEYNFNEIRDNVALNFPDFRDYNTVSNVTTKIGKGSKKTGNSSDDLAHIISDLLQIKWYLEKTTRKNGIWHFKHLYSINTGFHSIDLIRFIMFNKNNL